MRRSGGGINNTDVVDATPPTGSDAGSGAESDPPGDPRRPLIHRRHEAMEVSTRFSHFFQLKAVGGNDSHPVLTISGPERSGEDGIEVRYSPE